jgi:hypothetical protein
MHTQDDACGGGGAERSRASELLRNRLLPSLRGKATTLPATLQGAAMQATAAAAAAFNGTRASLSHAAATVAGVATSMR